MRSNLLLQSESAGRHTSADTADWTGTWVGVGFAEQLTEIGAVLPATIGHHAVHVRRTGSGLMAAVNAKPFGGCMSVPVHCGSTQNVRCPHLACAFSADTGVLDHRTDPSGQARREFVGDGRRTVELPLAQRGSLLFVNVTMTEPPPLPDAAAALATDVPVVGIESRLVSGNWLLTAERTALSFSGAAEITVIPPNVAFGRRGSDTVVVISRPAGHTRSTVVCGRIGVGCGPTHPRLNGEETGPEPR
ncbi:hypothetical protein BH10ACT9_BH10ACT9_49590 [soil metagenome]